MDAWMNSFILGLALSALGWVSKQGSTGNFQLGKAWPTIVFTTIFGALAYSLGFTESELMAAPFGYVLTEVGKRTKKLLGW